MPLSNSPVTSVTSPDITCNVNPTPATETVQVAAGATIGFKLDNTLYHPGPAAIYLGKAPSTAANWDGSGANWFKIAEWGAAFNPFTFTDENASQLTTTIPANTPAGEVSLQKLSYELHERSEFFFQYLVRIEQIALHVVGAPQWYISCAQIRVTSSGSGNPSKVSIPGYVQPDDPGLTVNIYYPAPTAYTVSPLVAFFPTKFLNLVIHFRYLDLLSGVDEIIRCSL